MSQVKDNKQDLQTVKELQSVSSCQNWL